MKKSKINCKKTRSLQFNIRFRADHGNPNMVETDAQESEVVILFLQAKQDL